MEEIKLPEKFKKKLDDGDKKYNAIVSEILKNFEDILNVSKLEFFPEYNNHGIIHLNNIFKIQNELITDISFDLMTIEDITTLIVSTLSHDIGMHLTYDGFITLINPNGVFSTKWKDKWEKFLNNARKYNENKLKQLFGDTTPIHNIPKEKVNFRNRDYMLIGEFLRVNHPELAEDILKIGFPMSNNEVLVFSEQLNKESKLLEFSSLLAKSHGMNLRDTFEEIQKIGYQNNLVFAHNIHIVYLMVILRLSDYMDIYKNRHPKIMLGIKKFMSEISKFEWDKNTSIIDENAYHQDKEAIFLGTEPKDSFTFINLKNLFKGIQYELDISWAVLGEVYSRDEKLKDLGIKYRRIRTNIDDEIEFSRNINYIPKKIAFDSDPELLKLLIAPLYGDDPSYGVRELLQNAVDACKEYQELNIDNNYKPKIVVNAVCKEDDCYFEIIDNGIGMTEATIINYFLKAGASFRNSDVWKEKFEDDNQKSKVERTGRFGVGLLAAFLLGNKIEVKTKNNESKYGFQFKTHLSDSQINILKDESFDRGTSIKITITKKIYNELLNSEKDDGSSGYYYRYENLRNWRKWYYLDDVEILFNQNPNNEVINEKNYTEIVQDEYTSVKWHYEPHKNQMLIINGFRIPQAEYELKSSLDVPFGISGNYYNKKFNTPTILIKDKNGKAPLSLSREKLIRNEFSFNETFVKSLSDDIFKKLTQYDVNKSKLNESIYFTHPLKNQKLIFSEKGFNLLNSWTIETSKINKLVFISLKENAHQILSNECNIFLKQLINKKIYMVLDEGEASQPSYGYHWILGDLAEKRLNLDKFFKIESANIIIPKEKHNSVFRYKNTSVKVGLKDKLTTSSKEIKSKRLPIPYKDASELWVRSYFIKEEQSIFSLEELDAYIDDINFIVEVFLDSKSIGVKKDVEYYFYNLMDNYFDNTKWIAYK